MFKYPPTIAIIVLLTGLAGVFAQNSTSEAHLAQTRIRFANFAPNTPPIALFMDDMYSLDVYPWRHPGFVGDYVSIEEFAGSAHTFSLKALSTTSTRHPTLLTRPGILIEPGHSYTYTAVGTGARLDLLIVDETEMLASRDVGQDAYGIFIHNITGVDTIDLRIDGEVIFSDLEYGSAVALPFPEQTSQEEVIASDTGTTIVSQEGSTYYPDVVSLIALMGNLPIEVHRTDAYWGDVSIHHGEALEDETVVSVQLELGERIRFPYSYASDLPLAFFSICSDETDAGQLAIYDGEGNFVDSGDLLNMDGLPFGDYFIEVSSWNDAYPGEYTLCVEKPDPIF